MSREQSMGLVVAGGLHRSFIPRMSTLLERLGPVKASSFPVARRAVRSLRAGYAVSHYSALEACQLIWIAVPESTLEQTVSDMASQMPVHGTMIVFFDMQRDSSWQNGLRAAGARVATVNYVSDARVLIGEGHPDTLRVLRKTFGKHHTFLEMLPTAKTALVAGVGLSAQLLLPWIDASTSCLRAAGLSRSEATTLVGSLSSNIVKAYASAGPKAWNPRWAAAIRKALAKDVENLKVFDPRIATLYWEGVRLALAHFAVWGRKPTQSVRNAAPSRSASNTSA